MPTVPAGLVVKSEKLLISTLDRDERGQKLEPEERPAKLVLDVQGAPVRVGQSSTRAHIPMSISSEDIVSTFAGSVRNRCNQCVYWDQKAWLAFKRQIETGANFEHKQWLNRLRYDLDCKQRTPERAARFEAGDGDYDIEAALNSGGLCRVITEALNDPMMSMPDAGCPKELSNGMEWEEQFRPKSVEADKRANQTFDTIMREASGLTR